MRSPTPPSTPSSNPASTACRPRPSRSNPRHRTPTSAAAPIINEGRKPTMLTHPTLDQMQALGLSGMAAAYRDLADQSNADDLSRDEWLGLMLDREAAMRDDKRLTNRLAVARLRFADACIENIDFAAPRGLDRRNTLSLAQGAWLKAHENLIITGQTGTGKTWLAFAFGRQAVMHLLRIFEIDRVDLEKREIAFAVLGTADLSHSVLY